MLGFFLFGSVGCDSSTAMQIQALQEDKASLTRELKDRDGQLRDAMLAADQNAQQALRLQRMVDDLQRQLSEVPEATEQDGWTIAGPFAWTDVQSEILFDSGKATLKPTARDALREIVQQIQDKFADRDVLVVGHTDNDPIKVTKNLWKDNLHLSEMRAYAVARELISLGIDPARMIAGGQGEYAPKVPNDTKANKKLNRRVQIIAVSRPQPSGS